MRSRLQSSLLAFLQLSQKISMPVPDSTRGASGCRSLSLLLPSPDPPQHGAAQLYLVKTPPASPNFVLLALSTTSSSVSKGRMDMTGPKISSFTHVMSSVQFPASTEISQLIQAPQLPPVHPPECPLGAHTEMGHAEHGFLQEFSDTHVEDASTMNFQDIPSTQGRM